MAFSIEYANVFSNVLAKENIFIKIDGSQSTAYFDLYERTLVLPEWDGTRELQRFLMCHEIAHCIFTPPEAWKTAIERYPANQQEAFKDVLNVFEDARIDRLMPEKYSAMRRWYHEGYKELCYNQDFFGLEENPAILLTFDLISKINTWTKTHVIGNPYNVQFDGKEEVWIDRAMTTRTFEEVIQLADDFFDQMDDESKERQSPTLKVFEFSLGDGPKSEQQETSLDGDSENAGFDYFDVSHKNKDHVLVGDDDYRKVISTRIPRVDDIMKYPLPSKAVINKMVTAFQRYKNARLYARALTTKTGSLDPLKLYSYRFTDDIMRRKTVVDKQKNHGFLVIVDMSGSMQTVWSSVVDHLYIMAMFCKSANIPFESYGFEDKEFFCPVTDGRFRFVPLINNADRPRRIMDTYQLLQNRRPSSFTPLTSAVHFAKTMTLDFQKTHNIDVMNVLFITDGDCTQSVVAKTYTDKTSRHMRQMCPNHRGGNDAIGPLMKILRYRTKANVWAYHIVNNGHNVPLSRFEEECGGTTGTFTIRTDILGNYNMFVDHFIEKMSEYGGKIDTTS